MSNGGRERRYRAPIWDEPIVMEMGAPGRRGFVPPATDPELAAATGPREDLVPAAMRRAEPPALPELTEFEVQRHYLHLAQETLGMLGVNLFGTCTMKYNPRLGEHLTARPEIAAVHPLQDEDTMQGTLAAIHGLDLILRELSGMDQFVFQAGGGADAAYTNTCVTRAYHAARGELGRRDEVITTIQAHPCNAATAAAAGFKVVTLTLEEDGYPSVEQLRAAVSERTAALMVTNPDDMGIYNPHIKEWVEIVHAAGGLCFYDHANFNGVMGKLRARELGFDACMYMLHKTFGAPKGGGGPAVGAYGCAAALVPFLPRPLVRREGERFRLERDAPQSVGKVREFWGNVPQIVKAYGWARAMGGDGIEAASDLSVLANNYMEDRLLAIRGVTKSHPQIGARRLEMTRYSLGTLTEETGVTVLDVENRMVDYGVDAPWLSHEPWIVPEPFTPEPGELWSIEDIDYWIDTLARVCEEAYADPELVKTAPHEQVIHRLDAARIDDPDYWATTWRAYLRKHGPRDRVPAGASGA
ncbi:MAG: aminomethyl-transferring glycine dehydrogenase subunit GcvPB [Actinobacteria bacterium]|nr:aminomethyl-transferring glycine dehydrogenase subunit GcvPB [Actinomycetota bacterium]